MKSPGTGSCVTWCGQLWAPSSRSVVDGANPRMWLFCSNHGRALRLGRRPPPTGSSSSVWIIINWLSDEELLCCSLVSAGSGQDRADDTFRLARDERCRHHQHKRVLGLSRVA